MKIEIATQSYNHRRYSKPYIATVDFTDPKGIVNWGQWVGSPGEEGILLIDAEPGDILMTGQRDGRGRNSLPEYRQVAADGSRTSELTRAEAFKAWRLRREVVVAA
jgi:hypothetical protein